MTVEPTTNDVVAGRRRRERRVRPGASASRRYWSAIAIALGLLVYDQAHLILAHASRWANEDHALLWLGARDLGSLRFYQPNFYGQSYFTMFGAIPTEMFRRLGANLATAGASSSVLLAIGSWLILAVGAWRRGHRVVGLLAVCAPIVLSTDSLLAASSAGGRDAGSFMACLGVAILLWSPRSARHVALFAVAAGFGVAWDFGSALLVVPAAAYALILNWSDRRVLVAGGLGAVPAGAWLVFTWLFYRTHPNYDTFKSGSFLPNAQDFGRAVSHIARYVAPAEPELVRWYVITLVGWAGLTVVLAATRRLVYALPATLPVIGFLYALSTNKILFAVDAVYLWKGRFFLALPFLFVFLAYLVAESGIIRVTPKRASVIVATLIAIVVATFVVRQVTFDRRMASVVKLSRKDGFASVTTVSRIERDCAKFARLARRAGTDLLVFRDEVLNPYACNALYYGTLKTLTPTIDRRAWRFDDESTISRTKVIVLDTYPGWCAQAYDKLGLACDPNTGIRGAVVLKFPRQPFLRLWRNLGEPIRPRR